MNIEELAVIIYEAVNDTNEIGAAASQIWDKTGSCKPCIEFTEALTQYRNTGVGLEACAQKIHPILFKPSVIEEVSLHSVSLTKDPNAFSVVLQHNKVKDRPVIVGSPTIVVPDMELNRFGQIALPVAPSSKHMILCDVDGLKGRDLTYEYACKVLEETYKDVAFVDANDAKTLLRHIREDQAVELTSIKYGDTITHDEYNHKLSKWSYEGTDYGVRYGSVKPWADYENERADRETKAAVEARAKEERLSVKAFRESDQDKLAYLEASEYITDPYEALHIAKYLEKRDGSVNLALLTEDSWSFYYETENYTEEYVISTLSDIKESFTENRAEGISECCWDIAKDEVREMEDDEIVDDHQGGREWSKIEEGKYIIEA